MADPKAPELDDEWLDYGAEGVVVLHRSMRRFTWDDIRALLYAHGLHICTEAERKVLEACAAMTIGIPSCAPRPPAKMCQIPKAGVMAVVEAELARRNGTT